MKRISIALMILSLTTGCASRTTKVNTIMDSWLNQNVEKLIAQVGPPSSIFNLSDGGKVYSWMHTEGDRAIYFPLGNTVIRRTVQNTCQVNWTTDVEGMMIGYRWNGSC